MMVFFGFWLCVSVTFQEMQTFLKKYQDTDREFGPVFEKYFYLHRNKETGDFVYAEPRLSVIRAELDMCGYFAIITSDKMDAKDAVTLMLACK